MLPSARLQASIDVLNSIKDGVLVDKALTDWGRSHRFAGSSDRAAIADTVYEILREKGFLSWVMQSDNARLLVLAWLKFSKKMDMNHIQELVSGQKYGLAPLTDVEKKLIQKSISLEKPFTARFNLPEWTEKYLNKAIDETEKTLFAMQKRANFTLRFNQLKVQNENELIEDIENDFNVKVKKCTYAKNGFIINESVSLKNYPLYQDGYIEVQDENSQIAATLCDVQPHTRVLDYCAGGGGKSLVFADMMQNTGEIIASDISEKRLEQLKIRALKAGAKNIRRIHKDRLYADKGKFDTVIVDAPCSGSGTWRRNVAEKWLLTEEKLFEYQCQQKQILQEASGFVEKSGHLIYMTCSYFQEENETVIEHFLKENKKFKLISVLDIWNKYFEIEAPKGMQDFGRLTPLDNGGDGFFIAILGYDNE